MQKNAAFCYTAFLIFMHFEEDVLLAHSPPFVQLELVVDWPFLLARFGRPGNIKRLFYHHFRLNQWHRNTFEFI